jgi:hypothetical protein
MGTLYQTEIKKISKVQIGKPICSHTHQPSTVQVSWNLNWCLLVEIVGDSLLDDRELETRFKEFKEATDDGREALPESTEGRLVICLVGHGIGKTLCISFGQKKFKVQIGI